MRKLFISADMEGCAAISAPHGIAPERWTWEWNDSRRWMTDEVAAACDAALEAGYDEVIVADSHHAAHNIEPDRLPENVRLIRSWPRPFIHMQGAEDPDVVACAFVGYHAGSTIGDSIMSHSYHGGSFRALWLNGEACSEGYLNAVYAGELGKPIIFVSGDQHTIVDAERYAPNAVGYVAKVSIGWRSQSSLQPAQVQVQLGAAAREAFARPLTEPYRVDGPYVLEMEMVAQVTAEMLAYLPGVERLSAYKVKVRFASAAAVMKFIAFAMLYSPMGVAL